MIEANKLEVQKLEGFEELLSDKAKVIANTEAHNTIFERVEVDSSVEEGYVRKTYLVQFIQKVVEYTDETEQDEMKKATQWLADYFNKAVEKDIVDFACLNKGAFYFELPSYEQMIEAQRNFRLLHPEPESSKEEKQFDEELLAKAKTKRRALCIWPVCKLQNATKKELNALMGEDGFKLEGEI